MEDIFISGVPLLESVGLHEPLVEELRANITNAMHKAMVPLQAYAKEYRKYLELNNHEYHHPECTMGVLGKKRESMDLRQRKGGDGEGRGKRRPI